MFVHVHDAQRLILFVLLSPGASQRDGDFAIEAFERLAVDTARAMRGRPTVVVFVKTGAAPPDADQRRRIAACVKKTPRFRFALVSSSRLARMVVTALDWLAPAAPDTLRSVHGTFEEAREWLVAKTAHKAEVFDAMYAELCERERAEQQRRPASMRPPAP
jgi:hypothetical protein